MKTALQYGEDSQMVLYFYKVAKIALMEQPQLREKLGLLERN